MSLCGTLYLTSSPDNLKVSTHVSPFSPTKTFIQILPPFFRHLKRLKTMVAYKPLWPIFTLSSYSLNDSVPGFVGLKNGGATCYMNAVLQQLYMIPELRAQLLSLPTSSPTSLADTKLHHVGVAQQVSPSSTPVCRGGPPSRPFFSSSSHPLCKGGPQRFSAVPPSSLGLRV